MRKTQLLGMTTLGLGGVLFVTSFTLSLYNTAACFISATQIPNSNNGCFLYYGAFGLGGAFASFFLIGLGVYFIFKPLLGLTQTNVAQTDNGEVAPGVTPPLPTVGPLPVNEKEKKREEQKRLLELQKIQSLPEAELRKELVSMKTIQHVLQPRLNSATNQQGQTSEQMRQMLDHVNIRIGIIEDELARRRTLEQTVLQTTNEA
jgi:hypothetical protein